MTFGGEPLLYPDVVCAVHRKAAERGIPTRQLITNGYFSKIPNSPAHRRKLSGSRPDPAAPLRGRVPPRDHSAGRCSPFCSLRHSRRNPSKLHPAWVVSQSHRNPYNEKTREILSAFGDLNLRFPPGNNIVLEGNAREYLEAYYERQPLDLSVKMRHHAVLRPADGRLLLSIAPNGDVLVCGFVIGNLYTGDIAEIVSRYDPRASEGMRAVLEGGVAALLSSRNAEGSRLTPLPTGRSVKSAIRLWNSWPVAERSILC